MAPSSLPTAPEAMLKYFVGSKFPPSRSLRSPPTGPSSRAIPLTSKLGVAIPPTRLARERQAGAVLLHLEVHLGHAGLEPVGPGSSTRSTRSGSAEGWRRHRRSARPRAGGPRRHREQDRHWLCRLGDKGGEAVAVDVLGGRSRAAAVGVGESEERPTERRRPPARVDRAVGGQRLSEGWRVSARTSTTSR